MSHFSVISDISLTLQKLLETGIVSTDTIEITLTSPQRVTLTTDRLINLYLYQVIENPFAKNQEPIRVGHNRLRHPPLALNLYYLLTPYAKDERDNKDEHLLLGEAMRVFYEHSILKDPILQGSLKGSSEEIKLVLCPMNLEELTRIWNSLQMSYRLSVCYEARIALVDSMLEREIKRVEIKETVYHQL
jgi:hypothetical protein